MAGHLPQSFQQVSRQTSSMPSYDSSSVSSSGSTPGLPPSGGNPFQSLPSHRTSGAPVTSNPHHISMSSSGSNPNLGARSYGSSSTSPGTAPQALQDTMAPNGTTGGTPTMSTGHLSGLQAQKRAYRQRRKDPSCDACRERKVKCDATDTTSCTECSSRNVKCQFTKETNRRMSSIKQVQDLEKQLAHARQQLSLYRSIVKDGGSMEMDSQAIAPEPSAPDIVAATVRNQSLPVTHDLMRIQSNLRNYGRGIMKPPPPYRQLGSQTLFSPQLPDFPPKHVADRLLSQYHASTHTLLPVVHWPSFQLKYEEVYSTGHVRAVLPGWASLFFAVLACGALHTIDSSLGRPLDARTYVDSSRSLIDHWNDDLTIDHARTALLISVVLTEMNLKASGWMWLGSSIRIAQDIGLHCEIGPWPVVEGEMRRRVWWGIYIWDRLLSFELGHPLSMDKHDYNVKLPCPVDDHYIQPQGIVIPQDIPQHSSPLLSAITIARVLSQLLESLKAPTITSHTIQTFEAHFSTCMDTISPNFQLEMSVYLDPRELSPITYLQNARLILHRHNISPASNPEVRAASIRLCYEAAKDTANLISRTMHSPSGTQIHPESQVDDWRARFATIASAMLCTHIWRCTLFLCFRGDYSAALMCVRASAAIGDLRPVNTACGRNLAFFLKCLVERLQRGEGGSLEKLEEMMVYVSGDLQGSMDHGWVWQGSETVTAPNSNNTSSLGEAVEVAVPSPKSTVLSQEEERDWGGWEGVEWVLQALVNEQQQQHPPPAASQNPPPVHDQSHSTTTYPQSTPNEPQSRNGNSDRISIANII